MRIDNSPINPIDQRQNTAANFSDQSKEQTLNRTPGNTVSISNAGLNAKDNWQNIASNYDVTNISQNEMAGMVSSLIDSQLISSTDSLYLMAPRSMNLNPDAKFDLLAKTEKALTFAKENGGSAENIKIQERVVDILKGLQALFNKIAT